MKDMPKSIFLLLLVVPASADYIDHITGKIGRKEFSNRDIRLAVYVG